MEYSKGAFFGIECLLREANYPHEVRAKTSLLWWVMLWVQVVSQSSATVTKVPFRDLVAILLADPHLNHRFWLLVCVTVAEKFHAWDMPKVIRFLVQFFLTLAGH